MEGELQKYEPVRGEIELSSGNAYERWMKKQRKPKTIKTYMEAMTRFAQFTGLSVLEAAEALLRCNKQEAYGLVEDFKVYLSEPHLVPKSDKPIVCGPSTINLSVCALRSFTKEAYKRGVIDWLLLVDSVPAPEPDRRGPGSVAIHNIFNFIKTTQEESPQLAARNAAMVSLLFFMCMRAEEVRTLDWEHVSLEQSRIMIMRKRGVSRVPLTLSSYALESLSIWSELKDNPGPVFPSFDPTGKGQAELDGRITYQGMRAAVMWLAEKSGFEENVRLHGFRHSGITYALHVTGGDVRAVQRLSGHKDIKVLMKYDDERRDLGGEVAEKMSQAWAELNKRNRARIRKS